jgi:CRISPR/Cas system-associated exonuclease Cas4 (RecB family)
MHLHQKINCQTPKSGADLSDWVEEHTRLVNESVNEWKQAGGTVSVEDENYFKINSKTGVCLSGKCDLVVGEDRSGSDTGVVIDIKTGRKRAKDRTQVMLYMSLLPAIPDVPHITNVPVGVVQYKDGSTLKISPEDITPVFKDQVRNLLELASGPLPEATPTFKECRFCDLNDDCPNAILDEPTAHEVDWL